MLQKVIDSWRCLEGSLTCPVCGSVLAVTANAAVCPSNHSFDFHRSGYLNLLLVSQKNSREPGDSLEMVKARQDFLDSGHYEPLSRTLNGLIGEALNPNARQRDRAGVLDAGCGQGYYLSELGKHLMTSGDIQLPCLVGTDISKGAIRLAASRHKTEAWMVTNIHRPLPFADSTFRVIFSIFAPVNLEEFARVLEPGGCLIVVGPGPKHLEELTRKIGIHDLLKQRDDAMPLIGYAHLELSTTQPLTFQMELNNRHLTQLLGMTPYYWFLPSQHSAELAATSEMTVTADFRIMTVHKAW